MRILTANYIFPIAQSPIKNGFLIIENNGIIVDSVQKLPSKYNEIIIEKFEGFLCPGLVNSHCHLELSHLKNKVPSEQGLADFIKNVQQIRKLENQEKEIAIKNANSELLENGTVAIGDVCNGLDSLWMKKNSTLYYHNFVEVYGLSEEKKMFVLIEARDIVNKFYGNINSSVTPHASYSVAKNILQEIAKSNSIISIHNQESAAENEFFLTKSGAIYDQLQNFGVDLSNWQAPKVSALQYTLPYLLESDRIQMVHNTFTSEEDLNFAMKYFDKLYWCFCPNANLYIEGILPNIPMFVEKSCKITVGTDSLASNNKLSIIEELVTIHQHYPLIQLTDLLRWATINGAEFLGIQEKYGSFEKGKQPGVVLIENVDLVNLELTNKSSSKRVV